jgi:outer membrane protein assembly factor BamB
MMKKTDISWRSRAAEFVTATAAVSIITAAPALAQTWPQWRGPQRDGQAAVAVPSKWADKPDEIWKVTVGTGYSSPLVADGRVYLLSRQGDQETVSAIDLKTGKTLWAQRYPAPYKVHPGASAHGAGPKSTPVLHAGKLYTLGIGGTLSSFDAANGTVVWRHAFDKEFRATSPTYGAAMSPIVEGGLVIAHVGGPDQGALRAFDAATGQTKWSWTEDGPGYASPVRVSW